MKQDRSQKIAGLGIFFILVFILASRYGKSFVTPFASDNMSSTKHALAQYPYIAIPIILIGGGIQAFLKYKSSITTSDRVIFGLTTLICGVGTVLVLSRIFQVYM